MTKPCEFCEKTISDNKRFCRACFDAVLQRAAELIDEAAEEYIREGAD